MVSLNVPQNVRSLMTSRNRIQSEQSLSMIRKLAIDYVNFIKECWIHASVRPFVSPFTIPSNAGL